MISIGSVLRQVQDPRGKQGLQHPLEALLGLILLSMLSSGKGMRAAFRLGLLCPASNLISWAFVGADLHYATKHLPQADD